MHAMTTPLCLLRLPDAAFAPGYRESLNARSRFGVTDFGDDIVGVAPTEGAGVVAPHFELHRLCDASSDLTADETWEPIREAPPRQRGEEDPTAYRDRLLRQAGELGKRPAEQVEAHISAFGLSALAVAETGELESLLREVMPNMFSEFPHGSLWYVTTSDVLLARLAFARTQLAFQLTPDLPAGPERDQLRAFSDLSLTGGIDFNGELNIPLLAFSPAALGFVLPALPHALVFCLGGKAELRRPWPWSLASIYRPRVLDPPAGLDRAPLIDAVQPADGPALLEWWVGRLNVTYSHITDPTRWVDGEGYYDAAAQTAWMITLERLLGDGLTLLAEPQASGLQRVLTSFDLLDKAEQLLGYGRTEGDAGKGFEALLRRGAVIPRARDAMSAMPMDIGQRLTDELQRLYDGLYREVRANTLAYRLTAKGAKVALTDPEKLVNISDETLVGTLARAVRNSSHGLLDLLRDHPDRYLLAANTDGVPLELPAAAPLIMLSLLADAEGVIDGSWRAKLIKQ